MRLIADLTFEIWSCTRIKSFAVLNLKPFWNSNYTSYHCSTPQNNPDWFPPMYFQLLLFVKLKEKEGINKYFSGEITSSS